MKTRFKLIFKEIQNGKPDIDLKLFQQSLPSTFFVEKVGDDYFVSIETKKEFDESSQYLIDRELDRHFFLTNVELKAEIIKRDYEKPVELIYGSHGRLHDNIFPQEWNYELPLQLRLWRMADESDDFRSNILYYFHIIELSYPDTKNKTDYPDYLDSSVPPHPRTECKFLRHLTAHAGDAKQTQLKTYCSYIGIPELMFDVTDVAYQGVMKGKVSLLKEQAMIAIEKHLTSMNDRNERGFVSKVIMCARWTT